MILQGAEIIFISAPYSQSTKHRLEIIMCEFERWLKNAEDGEVKEELLAIAGKEREIEDRFYKNLAFGTGGLRGVIGAGTNRMNIYVVKRATQGLATLICAEGEEAKKRGVAIAFDSVFRCVK